MSCLHAFHRALRPIGHTCCVKTCSMITMSLWQWFTFVKHSFNNDLTRHQETHSNITTYVKLTPAKAFRPYIRTSRNKKSGSREKETLIRSSGSREIDKNKHWTQEAKPISDCLDARTCENCPSWVASATSLVQPAAATWQNGHGKSLPAVDLIVGE